MSLSPVDVQRERRVSPDQNADRALSVHWTKAQPIVSAYIRSCVHDFHEAEDLLQEVAATAAEKFSEFDANRPFLSWAFGIARNKVLNHLRKKANDRLVFTEAVINQIADMYTELEPEVGERMRALEYCMKRIRGRARRLLDMRYVRQQSPATIASETGMTANAVYVMLHRVRRSLLECIEKRLELIANTTDPSQGSL